MIDEHFVLWTEKVFGIFYRKHGMPLISTKNKSQYTFNNKDFISKNYISRPSKRIEFYVHGETREGIFII